MTQIVLSVTQVVTVAKGAHAGGRGSEVVTLLVTCSGWHFRALAFQAFVMPTTACSSLWCSHALLVPPGEPMPVPKGEGAAVTAGTVNCEGSLTVRAERSGNDTAIADIVRMVEVAQARTAPVQRLADAVAGRFAYAVMGLAAGTFGFWASIGTRLFPQVSCLTVTGKRTIM